MPQSGTIIDEQNYVQDTYPQAQQGASFWAQLNPAQYAAFNGSSNALLIPVVWEAFQLNQQILNLTVADDDGKMVSFKDICYRNRTGGCAIDTGFLWYWNGDFATFVQSVNGSMTNPLVGNTTAFMQRAGTLTYWDGV